MQPVLYIRKPSSDNETVVRFADDDPFFSEISNFIDLIEDIEEEPAKPTILSDFRGLSPSFLLFIVSDHFL